MEDSLVLKFYLYGEIAELTSIRVLPTAAAREDPSEEGVEVLLGASAHFLDWDPRGKLDTAFLLALESRRGIFQPSSRA